MTEQLDATLVLDYSDALSAVQDLRSQVEDAFSSVALGFDTSAIDDLRNEQVEIPVAADTGPATADIQAIPEAAPNVDIPVGASVDEALASIASIPDAAPTVDIPVDAVTDNARSEIASLGDAVGPVEIPVDADTSGAQEAIAGLEADISNLGDSASGAQGDVGDLSGVTTGLGAASAATKGSVEGVGSAFSNIGPHAAGATAAVLAGVAGIQQLTSAGLRGNSALATFNSTTGEFGNAVRSVKVGSLNTDIGTLGHQLGSTNSEMELATASAFRYAQAAGRGGTTSATFANQVTALAANAVAANPSLGSVSDVTETLTTRLARGGARLAQYGISLGTAEIKSHGLAMGLGDLSGNLTAQEKAIAAADLAAQKYGAGIADNVGKASQNAQVQVANLGARFREFLERVGAPLVSPSIELMRELVPIGEAAAQTLGRLGQAVLPLAATLTTGLSVPLQQATGLLTGLPGPILEIASAVTIAGLALNRFGGAGFTSPLLNLTNIFQRMGPTAGIAGAAIGALGVQSGNTAEAMIGFAIAGASIGSAFGPVGTVVGGAAGALAGFGAQSIFASEASNRFDAGMKSLTSSIKSGSVPAIVDAYSHVANMRVENEKTTESWSILGVEVQTFGGVLGFWQGEQEKTSKTQQQARLEQTAWSEALKGGSASMLGTIGAFEQMGISTDKYQLGLRATVAAEQAMQQSQAQLQVTSAPLAQTLEQSATALGSTSLQAFQAENAILTVADADVKAESAHSAFVQAVASGNVTQVEAGAAALAASERQKAFSAAIIEGKSSAEAGTAGLKAFRDTLAGLAEDQSIPVGMRDKIREMVANLDAAASRKYEIDVDLNDKATVKALAIKNAVDAFLTGKPIDLIIEAIARGFPEAESTIANIKSHKNELENKPAVMTAILDDLSKGNFAAVELRLAALDAKEAKPKVDADASPATQRLQEVQIKLDALQGTGATVQIRGDNGQALGTIANTKTTVDATTGTMQISGNPALAQQATTGAKAYADTATGTITIGGDSAPANSTLIGTVGTIDTATGTVTINGNPAPANSQTQAAVTFADGSTGTITIDGNKTNADGQTVAAVTFADGSHGTVTIDGNPNPANGQVSGVVTYANGSTGTVNIAGNNAAAQAAIRALDGQTVTVNMRAQFADQLAGIPGGGPGGHAYVGGAAEHLPHYAAGGSGVPLGSSPAAGGFPAILHPGEFILSSDVVRRIKAGAASRGATGGLSDLNVPSLEHAAGLLADAAAAIAGNGGRASILVVPWDQAVRQHPELQRMSGDFLKGRG